MRPFLLLIIIFNGLSSLAQSFVGLPGSSLGVQQLTRNPAFVNTATNGPEFQIFAVSALAGSNSMAYSLQDGAISTEPGQKNRHVWENLDFLGPAATFQIRGKHQIGIYTRARQILRVGGVPAPLAALALADNGRLRDTVVTIENAGFGAHAFGELGFTYGRVLLDDYYRRLTFGATVKYMAGFLAASSAVSNARLVQDTGGQIESVRGDVRVAYTQQANTIAAGTATDFLASTGNRALALDLGVTYEFHPYGTPNEETPYQYRVSAALTDIGGITYKADSGSGQYRPNIARPSQDRSFDKKDGDRLADYIQDLAADTLLQRRETLTKFRMALPTALRLNGDFNLGGPVWLTADLLLSLQRTAGTLYTASYVDHLYLAPRLQFGAVSVGMPFGFIGYQTVTLGTVLQLGPVVLGSGSVLSSLMSNRLRTADAYLGFGFKVRPKKKTGW